MVVKPIAILKNSLFFVILALFYLDIPLVLEKARIPNISFFVGIMSVFVVSKISFTKSSIRPILLFIIVALSSATLSQLVMGGEGRGIALLTLCYSITLGYLLYCIYQHYEISNLVFLYFLFFLLLGGILEINFDLVKAISDDFGQLMHPNFYTSDMRDMNMVGSIRPKFFSSEPSHFAKFYVLMLICWYVSSSNPKKSLIAYVLAITGFLLNPTGITTVCFLIILALQFLSMKSIGKRIAFLVLIIPTFTIFLFPVIYSLLGDRISSMTKMEDISFIIRLILPAYLAIEALSNNILLGVGFGGRRILEDAYAYFFIGVDTAGIDFLDLFDSKFNNVFWEFIINFGLLFIGIELYFLCQILKNQGCSRNQIAKFLIVIIAMSNTFGGIALPRFWGYFFLILAAINYQKKPEKFF